MAGPLHKTARVVSVIAGTLVALSCGTNVRPRCSWLYLIYFFLVVYSPDNMTVCILGMGSAVRSSDEALVNREQPNRESAWPLAVIYDLGADSLQGAAGNLGMYVMGFAMGLLTDARGPRLTTLVGSICLVLGYYPIHRGMRWYPVDKTLYVDHDVCSLSKWRGLGSDHLLVLLCIPDRHRWLFGFLRCYQDGYVVLAVLDITGN